MRRLAFVFVPWGKTISFERATKKALGRRWGFQTKRSLFLWLRCVAEGAIAFCRPSELDESRHCCPFDDPPRPTQRAQTRPRRHIVKLVASHIRSAAGGGTPVETGGRNGHVRGTRSLSRRALGGDRDLGRLHRFRPRGAHPRDA